MTREEVEGGVAGARDQRRDPFNEPRPRAGSEALNVENVMSGSESARTDAAILDRLYPTLLSRLAQTMRRGRPSSFSADPLSKNVGKNLGSETDCIRLYLST